MDILNKKQFDCLFATICDTPKILNVGTTNKCNLHCVHCARSSDSSEIHHLSKDFILRAITGFAELGGHTVTFGGGEIFTRPDAMQLVEYALQKNLLVNIETNGTLINQETASALSLYRDCVAFSISIDSLIPEIHDVFRGVKGAYSAAVRGILFLRKVGLSVSIITVLNQKNIDDIEKIVSYALTEWGANHRLLPVLNEEGRGATLEGRKWALSVEKIYNFLSSRYWGMWRMLTDHFPEREIIVSIPRPFVPLDIPIYPVCLWGVRMIGLSVDGSIGLCHYSSNEPNLTAGFVKKDSLEKLWYKSSFFADLRSINQKSLQGICGNCVYGDICRGLCRLSAYKKYRRIDAPYPVCQKFYEHGLFPVDAMVSPQKDCHYFSKAV